MKSIPGPLSSVQKKNGGLDSARLSDALDSVPETSFRRITRLAAGLLEVPISFLSFVGEEGTRYASSIGPEETTARLPDAFRTCSLQSEEAVVVEDATEDDRFSLNPFVIGEPGLRFYAGIPLVAPGGHRIGTLSVLDLEPRHPSDAMVERLEDLAAMVVDELGLRHKVEDTLRKEHLALRSMYRITASHEISFKEKAQKLLQLGREYLGVPYGFVTRISEEVQHVLYASGTHPLLQPGERCPLRQAYCRETIREESPLALQDVSAEGWENDPAHETFGLGAYIGVQLTVEEALYGTICFAAPDARDHPFTRRERTFVELLTRWVSYELEQRRAKKRLKRQNERLERFASVLSHDLRNPLTVAKGRLDLAAVEDDSTHLKAADRALDRMNEIIENVLSLTWGGRTIEGNAQTVCRLKDVAEACWDHVETAEAQLQIEEDRSVEASESHLQQLLENLFRNAVEHGGEDVRVRVGQLSDGFFVEDDGPGIPPEKRENVFEMGRTSSETGTGLGLNIVKTIANAHGWCVSVTRGDTGGARFEITGIVPKEA